MIALDSLRTQIQLHNHIARRDLPKRIATVQFLLAGLWAAGLPWLALANLIWLVLLELVIWGLIRTTPDVTRISRRRVAVVLVTSTLVSAGYYLPGLVLSLQPDFGLALGGFAWLLAALSTNLVMYNALRAIFWSTAVMGIPATLAAVALNIDKAVQPAAPHTWLLPVAIITLYIVNTLQQLREYRDTHAELEGTRAELLGSLRQLEHMSQHDSLTGLQNRAAFGTRLDKMLTRASPDQQVAVLMIDLNGFKPINDTYGHAAGDAVLVAVADRLRDGLRPGAQAFRLGGDEFAVLAQADGPAAITALGDRLAEAIRAPVAFDDKQLLPAASLGAALAPSARISASALCAAADKAMFEAKQSRSSGTLVFDPHATTPRQSVTSRAALEHALAHEEIRPVYLPKFTIDGTRLVGLEALARWHHPSGEVWRPERFLPDLCELSLLPRLTQSMLRQVLTDMTRWRDAGYDPPRLSINVAPVALATESGRQELDWVLAQYPGFAPNLAFEITEDVYVLRAADPIAESLAHFRAQGVAIFLDDFGTGYGSYRHLQVLTPDQLKLDGSLVAALGQPGPAEAALAGFVHIAHGLGIQVVAEHVETAAQRDRLAQMGCDFGEGRFFSAELPAAQVPDLLEPAPKARSSPHRR